MYLDLIKEAINKNRDFPYFPIKQLRQLAKVYPGGKVKFWETKRYELVEKLRKNTLFGNCWINSGCPDILKIENRLSVLDETLSNSIDKLFSHLTDEEKQDFAKE